MPDNPSRRSRVRGTCPPTNPPSSHRDSPAFMRTVEELAKKSREYEALLAENFDCDLKHGIKLTIESPSWATLRGVAQFLVQAIAHFKEHRDVRKTEAYSEGPYSRALGAPRRAVAGCTLSHPGDERGTYLTAALWADAVINGYANADTLLQMIDNLSARKKAAQQDDWLLDVLAMLDRPNGEFEAFAAMLRHDNGR